ncbi:diphthine--ammonia ligase [Picrophilus oshimae]|uniref:ATPase n=1 Tax=Picrophilus torridus (strain ATCC 700027 / DSM 9790 / JCM 10055 / NBRC 100828 / KAW 2/3) TaxID=1122961 RepID=Q6L0F0_PICTO|nr:diphthine--ammonia ligase [Picrophilus oshimae]AAT43552.1 putative ATPase [Picrophilus oshimae DSM 9789]SMD31176.1 metal-binding-domain/4Fe-4S-binding-domain containing ABC transporter, ATP-binding protein [Picrophilus oshimae DSM 9789]
MKAVALFSGGKDSFLSAMIAMEQGFDVKRAVTIIPEEYSMMFHYPNAEKSRYAASLLSIDVEYIYESKFEEYILKLNDVDALVSGAIASDYQKTRIERLCTMSGIISFAPLWRKNQIEIIREIISREIRAMIVSVSAEGLNINDLGMEINNNYLKRLLNLNERYRINIAGEGGEYETFVFGLGKNVLNIKNKNIIWKGSGGYLDFEII